MSERILRYNEYLTESAKSIFGDIVEKAFISTYNYSNYDNDIKGIEARLNKEMDSIECDDKAIKYDESAIYIKFTTGKLVEFNNSEWAHIMVASSDIEYK